MVEPHNGRYILTNAGWAAVNSAEYIKLWEANGAYAIATFDKENFFVYFTVMKMHGNYDELEMAALVEKIEQKIKNMRAIEIQFDEEGSGKAWFIYY